MESGCSKIVEDTNNRARKRHCNPEDWKRTKAKRARYAPKSLPIFPRCGHKGKPYQPYQCTSHLTMSDVKKFHELFYGRKDKAAQDALILSFCTGAPPKRKRPRVNNREKSKAHTISIEYTIKTVEGTKIPVCRDAFLGVLGIKKDRVIRLVKKFGQTGLPPTEARGGDRVKNQNDAHKESIKNFVESLKCTESHYCRSDSPHRVYLPCELNVKKLWTMYNQQVKNSLRVKHCYFRTFFNRHFNVGFGTPLTDQCSKCLQFKEKIKHCTDLTAKNKLITNHTVHKLQAKTFYDMLKKADDPQTAVFSFDCEKNMPLPKLPDQQAYFSMQINFYHFCVVSGNSKSKISANNVWSFVWTEADRPRGSNEIASAVHHVLTNFEYSEAITTVRLFCDGCGGQNKNSTFMGMLCNWLCCSAPPHIKQCEVIFPVVGHSFIPPDRVFGNIEKAIRKQSEVLTPQGYINIIESWAKVLKMGQDCKVYDWKAETQKILKTPSNWHFKFKPCKRFIFTKSNDTVLLRGETLYRNDMGQAKGVCKRGQKITSMKPKELNIEVPLKPDKIKSIEGLLSNHYGEDYRANPTLQYLVQLFERNKELSGPGFDENSEPEDD